MRMAMIAMTTSNSINVKPRRAGRRQWSSPGVRLREEKSPQREPRAFQKRRCCVRWEGAMTSADKLSVVIAVAEHLVCHSGRAAQDDAESRVTTLRSKHDAVQIGRRMITSRKRGMPTPHPARLRCFAHRSSGIRSRPNFLTLCELTGTTTTCHAHPV